MTPTIAIPAITRANFFERQSLDDKDILGIKIIKLVHLILIQRIYWLDARVFRPQKNPSRHPGFFIEMSQTYGVNVQKPFTSV